MDDCIFCKIVKGEIPSAKIYEDEKVFAFMDAFPRQEGHTLIIPKEHFENIFELPDDIASHILKIGKLIATKIKEKLKCDGLNFIQSNGEAAGQVVMHYHMHLLPRYKGRDEGGVEHAMTSEIYEYKPADGEVAKIAELLKF